MSGQMNLSSLDQIAQIPVTGWGSWAKAIEAKLRHLRCLDTLDAIKIDDSML